MIRIAPIFGTLVLLVAVLLAPAPTHAQDAITIALAESAAPTQVSAEATILDAEGNVVREGTNRWTCVADPVGPMCGDEQWMSFLEAYINRTDDVDVTAVGIAYMLVGDQGVSNIDPFAESPSPNNEWVQTGPHMMLIVPDPALLEGIPTDPRGGGPYVMWADTPLAHVMIPLENNGVHMPHH
jgi:hypothetical protein